jgi:hypothetical protein
MTIMKNDALQTARDISRRLFPYCTVLLKLFVDCAGQKRALQVGSGTFVRVDETYGILTAYHCTIPLRGEFLLGLTAAPEGSAHNFTLERASINIVSIAIPTTDEYGPGLAFITIADWRKVETIKASKIFYDLLPDKDLILNDPPPISRSLWYVYRVPHERFEATESEAGFEMMMQFQHLSAVGDINRNYEKDGYDYAEMDVLPGDQEAPPESFGGMSGGALWQITIAPSQDSAFSPTGPFFSGVIFYQAISASGIRFLRCHFRHSIYQRVLQAFTQQADEDPCL